jgi:hypothetical protein
MDRASMDGWLTELGTGRPARGERLREKTASGQPCGRGRAHRPDLRSNKPTPMCVGFWPEIRPETHAHLCGFRWSDRKPKSVLRSGFFEPRSDRESIVHFRTQFRPSIECPFPNPDSAENPPLSSFPCFVLAGRSPFWPVNLGSTESTGRASTELVRVVVGRCVGFPTVSGFNRPATGGENRSRTATVGEKGSFVF